MLFKAQPYTILSDHLAWSIPQPLPLGQENLLCTTALCCCFRETERVGGALEQRQPAGKPTGQWQQGWPRSGHTVDETRGLLTVRNRGASQHPIQSGPRVVLVSLYSEGPLSKAAGPGATQRLGSRTKRRGRALGCILEGVLGLLHQEASTRRAPDADTLQGFWQQYQKHVRGGREAGCAASVRCSQHVSAL